jgi:LysM repeat protein
MKIPLFSKLTAPSRGRKVVRASARAARGHEDDYEMEPNMKLSHAFMVVLILHVVAVGGIYAFNHINARKSSNNILANLSDRFAQATGVSAPAAAPAVAAEPVRQPGDADDPLPLVTSDPVPTTPTAAPSAPAVATKEVPAPAPAVATTVPAPDRYQVAKGDNPYNIAKKFGVSYQDLLTLNAIEDPTKLQIGQELKIPPKGH